MNHISTAIGLTIIGYILYIAVAGTSMSTIDRVCDPVFVWPKKALISGAKIFAPSTQDGINSSFSAGQGRCRAWVWGTFYEDDYQAAVKAHGALNGSK